MKTGNKKILLICLILTGISLKYTKTSFAHLCDDVFLQAKDNLAVKVDVRDGQLRIAKQGKFRVFLLNTMDRTIENINLLAQSNEFGIEVKPAKKWTSFPKLAINDKQFFEVSLKRKAETQSGKYKINLTLVNGNDTSMIFKTVNLQDELKILTVPVMQNSIKIDGKADKKEWGNSLLCTSLHEYVETRSKIPWMKFYNVNKPTDVQTRFRFIHDANFLYCLIDLNKQSKQDIVTLFFAESYNNSPLQINVLCKNKKITSNIRRFACHAKFDGQKVELKIPLRYITSQNKKQFLINFRRNYNGKTSFWKGNYRSVENPLVYEKVILK